jgi:DNA-binding transcriptional ArsR family regulator
MSSRTAGGTVRAALAEAAKALAHEHRVELIEQLAQGPRSVEALAERAGLSLANASQHLQQLRRAGLVRTRREGKRVVYRLADEAERDIVSLLVPCGTWRNTPWPRWSALSRHIFGRAMSWSRSPLTICSPRCVRATSSSSMYAPRMNTASATCRVH